MTIKIINKSEHKLPEYETGASAGMDLRANISEAVILKPLARAIIKTGLFIELPVGFEAQVRPRSGLAVAKLLSPNGNFNVVLPFSEETSFIALAAKEALYPSKILHIRGQKSSPIKRSLICFSFKKQVVETQELTIEIARHQYTKEYTTLTKDFYLKL